MKTYPFVYAIIKLVERILGTTMQNMTGKTKSHVAIQDASLTSFPLVSIMSMISDAPKVSDSRLVMMENSCVALKVPS